MLKVTNKRHSLSLSSVMDWSNRADDKSRPVLKSDARQEEGCLNPDLSICSFIYHVLFILGTLLVVFAAFRNTLTW